MPTASTATSTPQPSVNAMTCSFQSGSPELTPSVAPNFFACSTRLASRSIAMILAAPYRPAVAITASPTGPAPITATTSPGLTCPYWTPISNPVGRMSLSSTPCWFVTPGGHLVHGGLGIRHAHVLGLRAVDQVAEDPADPGRSLVAQAVRENALLAEAAVTTGLDARDDHVVADGELGHRAAHLGDDADALVTENPARRDGRNVALQDVQIGAADRRRVDPAR